MSYHFITTLQLKGYSVSDGTLVGDKYNRLALLAGFHLVCPFSLARLYFPEVGEVVYSLARIRCTSSHAGVPSKVACPASDQLLPSHIPIKK